MTALHTPNVDQPIPLDQPLPHRKTLREWLIPLSERSTVRALVLLALDYALFFALITATVLLESVWAKLLCGSVAGFVIGRLFVIGHDACHQSLTPHRELNKVLGRIAFLPSLTPYSLWDTGHNVVHHGYTNLKGVDFVWTPLTAEEFAALGQGDEGNAEGHEELDQGGLSRTFTDPHLIESVGSPGGELPDRETSGGKHLSQVHALGRKTEAAPEKARANQSHLDDTHNRRNRGTQVEPDTEEDDGGDG